MEQEFLTIKDILRYLMRFKYIIILTVLVTAAAAYFLTKKQQRVYQASVSIIINFKAYSPVQEIKDYSYASFKEYEAFYNTEYERIKSEQLAQQVVKNYNLEQHPYFKDKVKKASQLPGYLQAILTVTPVEDSNKVLLGIQGTDPEFIAQLANYYAESYKDLNLKRKTDHLDKSLKWLEERVKEADQRVIEAEENLYSFKKENRIILTSSEDKRNVIIQKLYTLEEKYNELHLKRIDAEQEYLFVSKLKEIDTLSSKFVDTGYNELKLLLLNKENKLEILKEKYKPLNPKIISLNAQIKNINRQLKRIRDNYKKGIESHYRLLKKKEYQLRNLKNRAVANALKIEKNELLYKQNKRTANTETVIYQMLLSELKKNKLKRLLQNNNIEVLDYARPSLIPIKPNLKLNLAIGIILGGFLSVLLIFLILYFDKTIKTRDELEDVYGLTFLGHLPRDVKIDKEVVPYKELYAVNAPRSSFAENCRSITTNIDFMNTTSDSEKRSFVVTSPGPMEGKTTIAANLASTMAEQGSKIIVIDTDLRKPRLHKLFQTDNKVGITTYISGANKVDEIIRHSKVKNLDYISTGPIPPNALQILKSKQFQNLFKALLERYDRIIFDSPPTSAVSDALVLSKQVDGVILIAKYNTTNKHFLKEATIQFNAINANIIGVILNQADRSKISYYNYRKYDYYYYGKDS